MSAALAPIEGFLHEYRCTRLDERPGEEPTPPALREGYYVVASSAEKAIERARDEHRDRQCRLRFEAEVTKPPESKENDDE